MLAGNHAPNLPGAAGLRRAMTSAEKKALEELLRWCHTLEVQWHQTRTLGTHLLAPTLHHLLAA